MIAVERGFINVFTQPLVILGRNRPHHLIETGGIIYQGLERFAVMREKILKSATALDYPFLRDTAKLEAIINAERIQAAQTNRDDQAEQERNSSLDLHDLCNLRSVRPLREGSQDRY